MVVVRKRVIVHGRVQGVFFRDTIRRLADEHGVAGWVRNTWEGTVEAALEGAPAAVEKLVAFCREGPPAARVESVDVHEEQPEGVNDFRITG